MGPDRLSTQHGQQQQQHHHHLHQNHQIIIKKRPESLEDKQNTKKQRLESQPTVWTLGLESIHSPLSQKET